MASVHLPFTKCSLQKSHHYLIFFRRCPSKLWSLFRLHEIPTALLQYQAVWIFFPSANFFFEKYCFHELTFIWAGQEYMLQHSVWWWITVWSDEENQIFSDTIKAAFLIQVNDNNCFMRKSVVQKVIGENQQIFYFEKKKIIVVINQKCYFGLYSLFIYVNIYLCIYLLFISFLF